MSNFATAPKNNRDKKRECNHATDQKSISLIVSSPIKCTTALFSALMFKAVTIYPL
ncbi:MAG: hypothetical protein IJ852_01070 [Alphaproteobacteria bacterium]|nr:hypothetical protein [Alphaproteobacteria bacterium]